MTLKDYRYIIHISDIHIRLNYRHDEYREVFENLYKDLDEKNYNFDETLIIITGDLVHDKTTLSPELIILCTEFLNSLSLRYLTLIIAGNHDGFLNTSEKIDMITGVLHGKDMKNLHYLKKTEIVKFKNLLFGVNSVFEEKLIPGKDLDNYIFENNLTNNNITKIALYHGMIGTVKLQNLYDAKGGLSVEDFKDYDYVLLGDIHKFQYLNDEKTIAYSSSLISQNFSEYDDYHGYLLWDLKDKVSTYHPIKNNYQYKRAKLSGDIIDIDNKSFNIFEQTDKIKEYLPKNARIQVFLESNDFEKIKFLKNKLKDIYWVEINSLLTKYGETKKQNKIETNNNFYINRKDIINDILKNKYKKDIDINIIDWIENELKNNDIKTTREGDKFELLKLNFDNLFVYGENNEIDLSKYNEKDIILICGKNSSGKSSLIDIIVFNLYNDYAREVSSQVKKGNSGILNNEKKDGYSEVLIKISNQYYLIRREYKKNKKGLIETDSYLYKLVDKNEELNESNKKNKNNKSELYIYRNEQYKKKLMMEGTSINKEIVKLIGTKDNFLLMNMMMQNDNISFKNMSQTERKKMLLKLLELEKYDKMKTSMEEDRKKVNKNYDILKNEIDKIDINGLKQDIDKTDILIKDYKNRYQEKINEKEKVQEKINDLNIQYIPTTKLNNVIDENKLNSNITKLKEEITSMNESKQKIIERTKEIKEIFDQLYDKSTTFDSLIKEYNQQIEDLNNDLEHKIRLISTLYPCNYSSINDINIILKNLNDKLNKKNIIKEELVQKTEDYEQFMKKYQEKEQEINNYIIFNNDKLKQLNLVENIQTYDINMYNKNLQLLNDIENELINIEHNNNKVEKDLKMKNKKLEELKNEMSDDEMNEIKIEYNNNIEIKNEINKYEKEIDCYKRLINELEEHEYNPECEKCMKNPKVKELIRLTNILNETIKINNDLTKKLNNNINDQYENMKKINEDKDDINKVINLLNKQCKDTFEIIKKMNDSKIKYENIIQAYEITKTINDLKENKILKAHKNMVDEIKTEINELKYTLENNTVEKDIEKMENEKNIFLKNNDIKKMNEKTESDILIIKNSLKNIKENKKVIEDEHNKFMNVKNEIQELQNNEYKLEKIESMNILQLNNYEKEYSKVQEEKEKYENNAKIKDEIEMLEIINKKRNEEINKLNEEIMKLSETNNTRNKSKNEYEINKEKYQIAKYEKEKYELYKDILDKDGLSLYIIKTYLEFITNGINEIIEGQIDKKVIIYEEDEKINIEIKDANGESVEFIGGMETFITEIAFKIVLSKIMEMNRGNFIIIDEGISALDKDQLGKIDDLLHFINGHYEYIMLMSHIEEMKDKVNNKIYIKKDNGLSKIA